jgi:hypothetical protein
MPERLTLRGVQAGSPAEGVTFEELEPAVDSCPYVEDVDGGLPRPGQSQWLEEQSVEIALRADSESPEAESDARCIWADSAPEIARSR